MASFFILVHPPRCQNVENWVLLQKMVNQNSTYFIVISLLLLRINLTSRFVKLCNQREGTLINVIGNFFLQQRLIKVKSFNVIFRFWWLVFWKYSVYHILRFCAFLNIWKNLVHFIWNDVPILVFFDAWLTFSPLLKWMILFLNLLLIFFRFYNLCWSFKTFIITIDL